MNPNRKGQAGSPVSLGMKSASATPFANTSFILPHGLQLKQKVGMVDITNVVDAGATVVYTANNDYSAGDTVSIYYVDPVAYNLQAATILSATSTTFTITSTATGTYVSGGVAQKTGSIPVTIPAGINFVYAILVGAGGGGNISGSSGTGGGGVTWGWTFAATDCFIGRSVHSPSTLNMTRYGHLMAGGGGGAGTDGWNPGGAGGGNADGSTNFWGVPGGLTPTISGAKGNAGGGASGGQNIGGTGGDGISGGGGSPLTTAGSQTNIAGNGGSGLTGGGGAQASGTTGTRIGGNGGNGINILTGAITTGGTGSTTAGTTTAAGGGGGVAGNGSNAVGATAGIGGLGGGGAGASQANGGAGVLYLFY